jgi:hypothetical protein
MNSISAVVIVENIDLDADFMQRLSDELAALATDTEIIVVANGVVESGFLELKRLVADVPDCSCYVLGETIDVDAARAFGMEVAVGDFIILLTPRSAQSGRELIDSIPTTMQALQDGFDLVVATPRGGDRPGAFALLEAIAYRILSAMNGFPVRRIPSDLIAMTRDAALYILSKPNAELLIKARNAGPAYPVKILPGSYDSSSETDKRTLWQRASKALRLLVSVGAAPVRVIGVVTIISSMLSIFYAVYVVLIYLLKPDVAAGWTTLSLQIAGMMFLFSIMLALLSEYVVQIYTATSVRRRGLIVRELRSDRSSSANRLNVVDHTGSFKIGAPDSARIGDKSS